MAVGKGHRARVGADEQAVDVTAARLGEVPEPAVQADVRAAGKEDRAEVPVARADVENGAGQRCREQDARLDRADQDAVERHLAQVRAQDALGRRVGPHPLVPATER